MGTRDGRVVGKMVGTAVGCIVGNGVGGLITVHVRELPEPDAVYPALQVHVLAPE